MQAFSLLRFAFYYTSAPYDCKDRRLHLECFKSGRECGEDLFGLG